MYLACWRFFQQWTGGWPSLPMCIGEPWAPITLSWVCRLFRLYDQSLTTQTIPRNMPSVTCSNPVIGRIIKMGVDYIAFPLYMPEIHWISGTKYWYFFSKYMGVLNRWLCQFDIPESLLNILIFLLSCIFFLLNLWIFLFWIMTHKGMEGVCSFKGTKLNTVNKYIILCHFGGLFFLLHSYIDIVMYRR